MGCCGWVVVSLYSSVSHIMVSLTNKSLGLALEVVVKYKIFWVNKDKKTVVEQPQLDKFISQTGGKALPLFCSIFNPSVLNSENSYWEVWSKSKYKLDSKIKEKHENKQTSQWDKDISYAKLAHNVMCDTDESRPSHTQGGWWGDRNEVGCLHLPMIPPLSFDSADPVSCHIARDTKQISALG